jgi:transposase
MFARLGADIPRVTACGWMASLANIFRPVTDCMQAELLKSKVISLDDSPVKVQDRKKKQNIKRGYEWIMMGDDAHPVNVFHYIQSRGRAGPMNLLKGFTGYLQGDCYSGNLALCAQSGATMVACRAHDRRYYKKALSNNKKLAGEILDVYGELFEIERTANDLNLSADQRKKMREQESVPLIQKLKQLIDEHALAALPSSSFGKALAYSRNNWQVLNNYLLDGDLRIDNNLAEQQMKMFATGRKNWYFFGSDEAGEYASIMFSLFST